jgi:hypothetical protein
VGTSHHRGLQGRDRGGLDIRPTIAVTKARLTLPEIREAIELGRLTQDGVIVRAGGEVG